MEYPQIVEGASKEHGALSWPMIGDYQPVSDRMRSSNVVAGMCATRNRSFWVNIFWIRDFEFIKNRPAYSTDSWKLNILS